MCDVRTDEHGSGNQLEAAKEMTLQQLYDQLKHKRDLIIQVMVNQNQDGKNNFKAFSANVVAS